MVFADAYYLRQVIENLVRNAREAMAEQKEAREPTAEPKDAWIA